MPEIHLLALIRCNLCGVKVDECGAGCKSNVEVAASNSDSHLTGLTILYVGLPLSVVCCRWDPGSFAHQPYEVEHDRPIL